MSKTTDFTTAAISLLNMTGHKVWRNNNGAVYSEKFKCFLKNPAKKLGVPDIIGYRKNDGKAIWVEIKTGKDRLSVEQAYFLDEAKKNGCLTAVTGSIADLQLQMKQWCPVNKLTSINV